MAPHDRDPDADDTKRAGDRGEPDPEELDPWAARLRRGAAERFGTLLSLLTPTAVPLEFQILGKTLLHAAVVGAFVGLIGAGFFGALEFVQRLLLEQLAGYVPLRAVGEKLMASSDNPVFRPWVMLFLPALGALVAGLFMLLAPETRGGGGDAMIESFHHHGGIVRRRVAWVKALVSILTLGAGGSGGREGPTMQIGSALGSTIARLMRATPAERRVLFVAGVAAGMSAVFRTPLGAALLAVEVLYRDDFEIEALIPAVLASVISYAIVISIYGESTLLAHAPHYPFVPAHLPLYALLAIFVALLASGFVGMLRRVQRVTARLRIPVWTKPAAGALALGVLAVPLILIAGKQLGTEGHGLGIFGGGYGAAQVAIISADWMPSGWGGVEVLLLLCFAKLVASSLTIGSGGSAGDFAPSLVLGGLLGGAFGRAAQLLLHDPSIDPGAFALVGMGAFYGGIAHVPVSSLILVSELAGSYDLLVPLMLAVGVAFVALRNRSLYAAQPATRADAPARGASPATDLLLSVKAGDIVTRDRPHVSFTLESRATEVGRLIPESSWQDVFPVVDANGEIQGLITADVLRLLASDPELGRVAIAADIMQRPVTVRVDDDLRKAAEAMLAHGLREIPVTDADSRVVGLLDEADVFQAYLRASAKTSVTGSPPGDRHPPPEHVATPRRR